MQFEKISRNELNQVATGLINSYRDTPIWVFKGEMGAGKTTLIKEICDEIGVLDAVSSPTFSIVNEYLTASDETIYHFDFYRIEKEQEAVDIGTEEYFYD